MTETNPVIDKSRRAPKRDIDGVFLLDKPSGISSALALTKVRGIYRANKGGHTGSLDPLASGLLPICLGQAAKFSSYFLEGSKKYLATGKLGVITDSGDADGNIIQENPVTNEIEGIDEAISRFIGTITQVPPMYSAIKVNGRKLYQLAREGIEIERSPRDVYIRSIHINDMNLQDGEPSVTMTVSCSKGTYIRTLCHDIGEKLGCGACMKSLSRTRVGRFYIDDSFTINQIAALNLKGELSSIVAPVDSMFDYPRVQINKEYDKLLYNGNLLPLSAGKALDVGLADKVRIYNESGEFIGIYSMDDSRYKPVKIFSAVDAYNDKELRGGV